MASGNRSVRHDDLAGHAERLNEHPLRSLLEQDAGRVQRDVLATAGSVRRSAPELKRRGLDFVGIDVIGDYLTEINVTSPTGVRELDAACGDDLAGQFIDYLTRP